MCNKVFLVASFYLFALSMTAQDFISVFFTDQIDFLTNAAELPDGNFMYVGHSSGLSGSSTDMLLIKTDAYGEMLWARSLDDGMNQMLYDIQPTTSQSVIVSGQTSPEGPGILPDGYIAEIDFDGEIIWQRTLGGDQDDKIRSLKVLPEGGYLVSLMSNSFSPNNDYDMVMAQLSQSGDLIWSRAFGSDGYDVPLQAIRHSNGDIFVWGHQETPESQGYDAVILRLDAQGNLQDQTRFALSENELAWDMIEAPNGDLLVSGDTDSGAFGMNDAFVIRLTPELETVWSRQFGATSSEHAINLTHIENDMFAIGGASSSFGNGGLDVMMLHFNFDGNIKTVQSYGGEIKEVGHGMTPTSDDGMLIVGETRSFGEGFYSGFAVKINSDGENPCSTEVGDVFSADDINFNTGSAGIGLRAEEIEGSMPAFLVSTEVQVSEDHICTQAPPGVDAGDEFMTEAVNNRQDRLRLVPNPSPGQVTALVKATQETHSELVIFNLSGQQVFTKMIPAKRGNHSVRLPDLATGIYLARLSTGKEVETRKLIIE